MEKLCTKLQAGQVSTVLIGADCENNTITLQLPPVMSPRGMTVGEVISICMPNAAGQSPAEHNCKTCYNATKDGMRNDDTRNWANPCNDCIHRFWDAWKEKPNAKPATERVRDSLQSDVGTPNIKE